MFPNRFFALRYFAQRYWPKVGAQSVVLTGPIRIGAAQGQRLGLTCSSYQPADMDGAYQGAVDGGVHGVEVIQSARCGVQ